MDGGEEMKIVKAKITRSENSINVAYVFEDGSELTEEQVCDILNQHFQRIKNDPTATASNRDAP